MVIGDEKMGILCLFACLKEVTLLIVGAIVVETRFAFSANIIPYRRRWNKRKFRSRTLLKFWQVISYLIYLFFLLTWEEKKFILCIFQFSQANIIVDTFDKDNLQL